jgi:hypothetical protein
LIELFAPSFTVSKMLFLIYQPIIQLIWGCGGSVGMWWLSWGCGGSDGDVVAQLGMWWLSGDVVAQRGCGGSAGDVVAQWGCYGIQQVAGAAEGACYYVFWENGKGISIKT